MECILRTRTLKEFPDSLSVFVFWKRNLQYFVFHCRAYTEIHGSARNPHGICKILYSLSTRVQAILIKNCNFLQTPLTYCELTLCWIGLMEDKFQGKESSLKKRSHSSRRKRCSIQATKLTTVNCRYTLIKKAYSFFGYFSGLGKTVLSLRSPMSNLFTTVPLENSLRCGVNDIDT